MLFKKKTLGQETGIQNPSFFRRLFQKKEKGISLNGYLRIAGICYRVAFPKEAGKSDLKLYQTFSDARHGGMLDMRRAKSVRAFGKWLSSDEWRGCHPFEIVRGMDSLGIQLTPPMEGRPFRLSFNAAIRANDYLKMASALAENKISHEAPDIEKAKEIVRKAALEKGE